jgi:putative membrane protein
MKQLMYCALAIGCAIGSACDDDDDGDKNLNQTDRNFVMNAGMGNQAEIELGQLASTKGEEEGVRAYGTMMVTDHQPTLEELENIVDDFNVDVPRTLDAEHQQKKQMLMTLSGYTFDTAYIHSQVKDHQKMIALFESQIANGMEQRLKDYASKHLPHLQEHLETADSISTALDQQ